MRMFVCGQQVGPMGHAWSQAIAAGGKKSDLLCVGDGAATVGRLQLVELPANVYGKPGRERLPGSGIICVGAGARFWQIPVSILWTCAYSI